MRQSNDAITNSENWIVEETRSWIHILPENDMAFHRLHSFCSCKPILRDFEAGKKRILRHFAFDGRDYNSFDAVEPIQFDLPVAIDASTFPAVWQ